MLSTFARPASCGFALSPQLHAHPMTNLVRYVVFAVLLCAVVSRPPAAVAQANEGKVLDQIAAVVGDEIVLKSDVDRVMTNMVQQGQTSYSDQAWMEVLQQLIDREVLADRAQADTTLTVSDQQVEQQLERQVSQIVQQVGSEERVEQIYGKSILQLKEDFRQDMRNQLLAQQFRGRRMQDIDVTPSEVRTWFERIPQDSLPRLPATVRLAHVVRYPKPSEDARTEAREIISAIRDSIVNSGASMEDMARRFSDDPGSAPDGGRIDNINLDQLVPEFAAVAGRVPIGEVSQTFYNSQQSGYHIVRVDERAGNSVSFNHILIRVDQTDYNEGPVRKYLGAVRDTLVDRNVPFALMARRHSEEERSANNSGRVVDPRSGQRDLVLNALGPSWRSTIDTMDVSEISKPAEVRLLNGERAFHIVKLRRRTPAHRVNMELDYERIKEFALQEKQARVMREWLDELRSETYVDIRISPDDLTAARQP